MALSIEEKYDGTVAVFASGSLSHHFADNGQFDPARLATLSKSFVELGILTQQPDTTKLIDTRFLPEH